MIGYRYAKALFTLSGSSEQMVAYETTLAALNGLLKTKPDVRTYFLNPHIKREHKTELLQKAIPDRSLFHFLCILLEQGKFRYLQDITDNYRQMVSAHSQMIEAVLITAIPIDDTLTSKLKERLEKGYHKSVTLVNKVDPHLLGGAIIILGHQILDFSLRGRLEKMKRTLQRNYDT
jgi:F-type H+-transporting ATPase subunit delta